MKKLLYVLFSMFLVIFLTGCTKYEYSTDFNNKTYYLKWSSEKDNGYINEYILKNTTLDNWEEMITVSTFTNISSHRDFALKMAALLKSNKVSPAVELKDDYSFIGFCLPAQMPKANVECNFMKMLNKDNELYTFNYNLRYFLDEHNPEQIKDSINSSFKTIAYKVLDVEIPQIVKSNKKAKASYAYGIITNK